MQSGINVKLQKYALLFSVNAGGKFVLHFQFQYLILFQCWIQNKTMIFILFGFI